MMDFTFSIQFGTVSYHYSTMFAIYLVVGWAAVLLHSRQNFDQPTYDFTQNEPASIMMPRVFSLQRLYLRGFLIYLAGMSGIYLCLSLAGPAVVMPIVAGFSNPTSLTAPFAGLPTRAGNSADEPKPGTVTPTGSGQSTKDTPPDSPVPNQWPLALALAIVGLAPNITGLRRPELLLRRFSHKIALIPAYAKYVAFEMQRSHFEGAGLTGFRYSTVGVGYQPHADSSDVLDQQWRKICVIFAHVKRLSDGRDLPLGGHAADDATRAPLVKEVQMFSALLRDLDGRLLTPDLSPEGKTALEDDVQKLLLRLYLLTACAMILLGVWDYTPELKSMGFSQFGAKPPTFGPVLMSLTALFGVLLLINLTLLTAFGDAIADVVPSSFSLNCVSTSYIVAIYGVAAATAIKQHDRLEASGWARNLTDIVGSFTPIFKIAASGYAASWVLLAILLFPFLGLKGLENLIAFATLRSLAPGVGGVVVALWLRRSNNVTISILTRRCILGSLAVASSAAFSSLLLMHQSQTHTSGLQLAFDGGQAFLAGMALIWLAEVLRTIREGLTSLPPRSWEAVPAQ